MGQHEVTLIYTYYTSEKEKEEMGEKYMKKFLKGWKFSIFDENQNCTGSRSSAKTKARNIKKTTGTSLVV